MAGSPICPTRRSNGPSTFVGDGCDPATIPAAPADDADPDTDDIALVERGGAVPGSDPPFCGFADKFDNVQAKGWDGLIVFNQVRPDDGQVNMLTGDGGIPGVQMRRVDAIGADGVLRRRDPTTPTPAAAPPARTSSIGQEFDGWGYAHLFDAKTGEELDAYSIAEGQDPRFANGFGDLRSTSWRPILDEPGLQRLLRGRHPRVPVQP